MRGSFRWHLILLLATTFEVQTLADTDPSLSQVMRRFGQVTLSKRRR